MTNIKALLARSYNRQGELYHFQGQYTDARQCYEDALSYYEEAHTASCNNSIKAYECDICCADIAIVQSNVAKLYDDMGDYDDAKSHYEKAIEMLKKILEDRLDTSTASRLVTTLLNLGVLYDQRWREYTKAAEYYNQAIDVSRVHLRDQSQVTLSIRAHQAQLGLDRASDRPEDAGKKLRYGSETEAMFLNVVSTYERAVDEGVLYASMQLARWRNNLAVIYYARQKPGLALQQFEQARQLGKDKGWTSHFSYAVLLTNYAKLLQHQGDRADANTRYKTAEKIYRDKKGDYYQFYQVADFLYDYAQFFLEADNYETAMELLVKAINIYSCQKPCLGHDKVIHALVTYQKHYRKGSPGHETPDELYTRMLIAYETHRVQPNPQIAHIQRSYALYLDSYGQYEQARQLYESAFALYNQALNAYIPGSSLQENWLIIENPVPLEYGRAVQILQEIELALKEYATLLIEKLMGKAIMYSNVSSKTGNPVENVYEKALVTFEKILGNDHWLMADVYGGYSACLDKIDKKRRDEMRNKATRIRQMYPKSTYDVRNDNHLPALFW